jgi:rare lipoprotein A
MNWRVLVAVFVMLLAAVCMLPRAHAATMCRASWYGSESGHRTASGEHFNPNGMTAAHPYLPLGTHLRVTWRGRSVIVRVNDRGPARWTHRCIDLSHGAARRLGIIHAGTALVTISK